MQSVSSRVGFSFHPRCKQLGLTTLVFADDLLIFCKPLVATLRMIKGELEAFAAESGLSANASKTSMFFGGLDALQRADRVSVMGFRIGQLPFRYLGIPLHSRILRMGDYQQLLCKIQSSISSRQARHLSYAGRIQVIKDVLESVISFWMQVIVFPKGVIRRIEALFRSYLWTREIGNHRELVAWKTVCRPRECGGLGFNELLSWNKALVFRFVFDIHMSRESIWTEWAGRNLLKGSSIWQVQAVALSSSCWRKSLHTRDSFVERVQQRDNAIDERVKPSGKYDSAAAYLLFAQTGSLIPWCSTTWQGIQSNKWAFLCWVATLNRLPMKAKLLCWGIIQDNSCVLCHNEEESARHAWSDCSTMAEVIDTVMRWKGVIVRKKTLMDWWVWFGDCRKRHNNIYLVCLNAFMGCIYHVWKLRNDIIFNNRVLNVGEVIMEVIEICKFRMIFKLRTSGRRGRAMVRRMHTN